MKKYVFRTEEKTEKRFETLSLFPGYNEDETRRLHTKQHEAKPLPSLTKLLIYIILLLVAAVIAAGVYGYMHCWFGHAWLAADCESAAVCARCSVKIGNPGEHIWQPVVGDGYLKSEATDTSPAVYYYSCSKCGARGSETDTFTYGECADYAADAYAATAMTAHSDPDVNYSAGSTGIVTPYVLNIRAAATVESERVGSYNVGDQITILETNNGWGRTDKGWVSMDSVRVASTGIVTSYILNIRAAATAESERVGSYSVGDQITILETLNGWGRTDKGWINMDSVKMLSTGTVTSYVLNIRAAATVESERVGSYSVGDQITILETLNGWGRTDKGWVSMDSVRMGN